MQKLLSELKNVPRNASLVCSSTRYMLNRVERLSAYNKVLTNNNLEVNLAVLKSLAIKLESIYHKNFSNFKLELV